MNYMDKLQAAVNHIMDGEDIKALPLLQQITNLYESDDAYKEKDGKKNVSFDEDFEYLLYGLQGDAENVNWIHEPISLVYLFEATAHMDLGEFAAAVPCLDHALEWNPCSAKARLAKADALLEQGDLEGYYNVTMEAFPYIFHSEEMGQAYRNLGYYYGEKESYDAAVSCYGLSMIYEQSQEGVDGMAALQKKHPDKMHMPNDDELAEISERYGFPITPNASVLTLVTMQIQGARAHGDKATEKKYLNIIYDLKQGEVFKQYTDSLNSQKEDGEE